MSSLGLKPRQRAIRRFVINAYIACIDADIADTKELAVAPNYPGEFEQMVLLAILRLEDGAFALSVLRELDKQTGRRVSRGALYKTLERLEEKGFVEWEVEETVPGRGGHPRRRFSVTKDGVGALRTSRDALFRLWQGLDGVLGEPGL